MYSYDKSYKFLNDILYNILLTLQAQVVDRLSGTRCDLTLRTKIKQHPTVRLLREGTAVVLKTAKELNIINAIKYLRNEMNTCLAAFSSWKVVNVYDIIIQYNITKLLFYVSWRQYNCLKGLYSVVVLSFISLL